MSKELPPIDEERKLILEPVEIIDVREKKLRSRTIKEFLVQWKDLPQGCHLGRRANSRASKFAIA